MGKIQIFSPISIKCTQIYIFAHFFIKKYCQTITVDKEIGRVYKHSQKTVPTHHPTQHFL